MKDDPKLFYYELSDSLLKRRTHVGCMFHDWRESVTTLPGNVTLYCTRCLVVTSAILVEGPAGEVM